jgi:hypothetical protein
MMNLQDFLAEVEARKAALGLQDTPEMTAAMRNKGARRTPAKRALLQRIADRVNGARHDPETSHPA